MTIAPAPARRLRGIAISSGIAALALAASLTGCASDSNTGRTGAGGDDGSGETVVQPPLSGAWILVGGTDADGELAPTDARVLLDLTGEGKVAGNGGCNGFSGTVTDQPGEGATAPLEFGPLLSTKMACADPAATNLESRFLIALGSADAYSLSDGKLVITGPDIELDFDEQPNENQ